VVAEVLVLKSDVSTEEVTALASEAVKNGKLSGVSENLGAFNTFRQKCTIVETGGNIVEVGEVAEEAWLEECPEVGRNARDTRHTKTSTSTTIKASTTNVTTNITTTVTTLPPHHHHITTTSPPHHHQHHHHTSTTIAPHYHHCYH
jgi:hypothetical protein